MPSKIVDLSARSDIIRDEPFHVHFWECTVKEFADYLGNPRPFLKAIGIDIPADCRIETTIENHDWLGEKVPGLKADNGPVIICNVGGGNVARQVYRVVSYAHEHSSVGQFKKTLLHKPHEQQKP